MNDNFFSVNTPSSKLTKITKTSNNVYSFFTHPLSAPLAEWFYTDVLVAGNNEAMSNCFPRRWTGSRSVFPINDQNPAHSFCHKDKSEQYITHHHLSKDTHELFTKEEMRCVLSNLQKVQDKNGLCKDGKTNCLISDVDLNKAIKEYDTFYDKNKNIKNEINPAELPEQPNSPKKLGWDLFQITSSSMGYAFCSTILRQYVRPKLITLGYSQYIKAIEPACSLIIWILSSCTTALTDFIISTALNYVLNHLECDKFTRDIIRTHFSSALILFSTEMQRFDKSAAKFLPLNQVGTLVGEMLAFLVIQKLPKIKEEPPLFIDNSTTEKNTTSNESQHPTIRHRRKGR